MSRESIRERIERKVKDRPGHMATTQLSPEEFREIVGVDMADSDGPEMRQFQGAVEDLQASGVLEKRVIRSGSGKDGRIVFIARRALKAPDRQWEEARAGLAAQRALLEEFREKEREFKNAKGAAPRKEALLVLNRGVGGGEIHLPSCAHVFKIAFQNLELVEGTEKEREALREKGTLPKKKIGALMKEGLDGCAACLPDFHGK